MKKILLATDGSSHAVRAAAQAGELARCMDATVTIFYVTHVPRELTLADAEGRSLVLDVPLDVLIRRASEPVIVSARDALNLPENRVCAEVQIGSPAEEIVELARLEHYDLIVMGTRGLSPIKEILIGSVSERVVRTAPCPVLIVR